MSRGARTALSRRLLSALVLAAVAVGVAGCTDPSPERPEPTPTQTPEEDEAEQENQPEPEPQFGQADVAHAQQLIGLHRTSLELHEIIRSKADMTDDVNVLSLSLYTTHYDELTVLEQMLTDWGEPVPEGNGTGDDPADDGAADEGSGDDDGAADEGADDDAASEEDGDEQEPVAESDPVVTDEQIRELGRASGQGANALYLQHMIALHQARSAVAEDQILEGENPELVDLAQTMLTNQQHDITHMRELLADLDVPDDEDDDAPASEDDAG